jgi:hypothetical protein
LAFAQLTYRESLRDIETCLRAHQSQLYHMGFRGAVSRNTLANANQQRDWRIYAPSISRNRSGWNWTRRSTPSIPPPSICACRFSPGHSFGGTRVRSSFTPCWTSAATSRPLFT